MANLLSFEVTMMATKGHLALFLLAQASKFLSLWRRGKDGWADLDSHSASSGQGATESVCSSVKWGCYHRVGTQYTLASQGGNTLINAGFLCPLLRSSGLHQDAAPGAGPVVPVMVGKARAGCGDVAAIYYYLLWFWLSQKCS